jgi:hypothetical protein
MKTKLLLLTLAAFMLLPLFAYTQENSLKDTVWVRRTDQMNGFYMVKFSKTDKYIVGMGYEVSIFFDSETGQELKRIPHHAAVYFLNNDTQFLQTNKDKDNIFIYDFETLDIIDSLENDGRRIGRAKNEGGGLIWIDKNETHLLALIDNGFRMWDLNTKKILWTKDYNEDDELVERDDRQITVDCENKYIIINQYNKYNTGKPYPNNYTWLKNNIFYDYNTLDEIYQTDNYYFSHELSNTCKYIAYKSGLEDSKYYGVLIHDPNTHELITKIPVNGPSLSGIEFTSDDRFLLTSNGPGPNYTKVWNTNNWDNVYTYIDMGADNFDISHDDKYIIAGGVGYLMKFFFRTEPNSINEDKPDVIEISPNPVESILFLNNLASDTYQISLISINGNDLGLLYDGYINDTIRLDVSKYPTGAYILNIESESKTYNKKFVIVR